MNTEHTLSIIKPDAVGNSKIGEILALIESNNLKIVAGKLLHLTKQQAEEFYAEHAERPFYADLVAFMTSGPVFVSVLSAPGAILDYRTLMGDTNPKDAKPGTIRSLFAKSIDANAVHGSDSPKSAAREISFFFDENEIIK